MKNKTIAILIAVTTSLCGMAYILPHIAKADEASCIAQLNQPLQAEASSSIQQLESESTANSINTQTSCAGLGIAEETARRGMGVNSAITSNLQETCNDDINQINAGYDQSVATIESQLAEEEANNETLCAEEATEEQLEQEIIPPTLTQPDYTPTADTTPSSIVTTSPVTQNLQLGDSGAQVVALQSFLESEGYLSMPAGVAEGYFGSMTKEALATFQLAAGLPNTGYCGPMTRAMIGEVEASASSNANQ